MAVNLAIQLKWYHCKVVFCHQSTPLPHKTLINPFALPSQPSLTYIPCLLVSISYYEKIFWSLHCFYLWCSLLFSKVSNQFQPSSRCIFIALLGTSCWHECRSPGVIQNGPIWADWTRRCRVCSSGHLQLWVTDSEKSRSLFKDDLVDNGIYVITASMERAEKINYGKSKKNSLLTEPAIRKNMGKIHYRFTYWN